MTTEQYPPPNCPINSWSVHPRLQHTGAYVRRINPQHSTVVPQPTHARMTPGLAQRTRARVAFAFRVCTVSPPKRASSAGSRFSKTPQFSNRAEPTVRGKMRACHEARLVGEKKERHVGNVNRAAQAALRLDNVSLRRFDALSRQVADLGAAVRRVDKARADAIDADIPVAELDADGACEHVARALGRIVRHLGR